MRCLHAIRPILFAGKTTIWRTLPLVALIMICLTGAIQVKTFVGSLQTPEGDLFAERAGRLVLARNRGHAAPQVDGWHGVWKISSPYFKTATGKFLAIEQSEQGVKVSLADESSESTRWVIDVIESTSPKRSTSRGLVEGESRSKFRLSISSGRYKGWYLAAKEPTKAEAGDGTNQPDVREFIVVQHPKQALTFDYRDTSYKVDHK